MPIIWIVSQEKKGPLNNALAAFYIKIGSSLIYVSTFQLVFRPAILTKSLKALTQWETSRCTWIRLADVSFATSNHGRFPRNSCSSRTRDMQCIHLHIRYRRRLDDNASKYLETIKGLLKSMLIFNNSRTVLIHFQHVYSTDK